MNLIQLQPDDVLVLRCPGRMSQAQRDAALAGLRDYLGPYRKVIFLDAGEALDVIRVAVSGKVETNDIVRHAPPETTEAEDATWLAAAAEARAGGFVGAPEGLGQREVQHVDVPEEEPAGTPPHVWLYRNMLTDLQALAPLGRDETNGQYAVAVDQLTGEQIETPHIRDQLALRDDEMGDMARALKGDKARADALAERAEGDLMSTAYKALHRSNNPT